jgi:hypothetical protein
MVDEFEYDMTDDIGKDRVLQSLPPSYNALVEVYVMTEFKDNFHQCFAQIRSLKVEPGAGQIVNPIVICDIQYYKCFINTYAVLKYEILIQVL